MSICLFEPELLFGSVVCIAPQTVGGSVKRLIKNCKKNHADIYNFTDEMFFPVDRVILKLAPVSFGLFSNNSILP